MVIHEGHCELFERSNQPFFLFRSQVTILILKHLESSTNQPENTSDRRIGKLRFHLQLRSGFCANKNVWCSITFGVGRNR